MVRHEAQAMGSDAGGYRLAPNQAARREASGAVTASARKLRTILCSRLTHGAKVRPWTCTRSSRVTLGSSPTTSTQMVSAVPRSGSIAVSRTTQTGVPSGVWACASRFFGSFFGLAVPATRNLTSLVSSFRRMVLVPSCANWLEPVGVYPKYYWLKPLDVNPSG